MSEDLHSLADVEAEELRRKLLSSLWEFSKCAWEHVEPAPLIENWHMKMICDEVQSLLTSADGGQTIINIPPGTAKSLLVSVFAPTWMWLHKPTWRAIFGSANDRVSTRDSLKRRELMGGEWYQRVFAPSWRFSSNQDVKTLYKNTATGFHQAITTGQKVTGDRADALFLDDPLDAKDATSKAERDAVIYWYDQAFANRVSNPKSAVRIVIAQRLHEEDLPGHLLQQGGWKHICIPMEFEAANAYEGDPRTEEGQLLFPDRFPHHVLDAERLRLGSAGYAGQMQQRPVAATGNRFQRGWWRFWSADGQPRGRRPDGCSGAPPTRFNVMADKFDEIVGSWDLSFKGKDTSDFVVGVTVARKGTDRFIVDLYRKRSGFIEAQRAIRQQFKDWPRMRQILVEGKANGSAVVETLASEFPRIIEVEPMGGKEPRAAILEPVVEAGHWYLPEGAEWLGDFIDEFAAFPLGKNDDIVDSVSQCEIRFLESADMTRARKLLAVRM